MGRYVQPVPNPYDPNLPTAGAATRASMPTIQAVTPPRLN